MSKSFEMREIMICVLSLIAVAVIAFMTWSCVKVCLKDMLSYNSQRGKQQENENQLDKPQRKAWTTSKVIAVGILLVDGVATMAVLALCGLAILRDFTGALPYLTTLIGALQAATGYVLGHYFKKSAQENTKGGIVYDAALGSVPDSDTDL